MDLRPAAPSDVVANSAGVSLAAEISTPTGRNKLFLPLDGETAGRVAITAAGEEPP